MLQKVFIGLTVVTAFFVLSVELPSRSVSNLLEQHQTTILSDTRRQTGLQIQGQSYEDVRCKCVCPNPSVVNGTQSNRKLYIGNVPPNKCNCDTVILPRVGDDIKGKEQEFCPRCECKYESRNTTIIKVVVIIVIWIISLLVIYMLFLICLDPLLNKRAKGSYQEHTNEDDETNTAVGGGTSHAMGVRGNVLNRVGHQQDKWKRQVREQRRNIYDRHTMLN